MTSAIVPPVDLAPGMPSRVVTISATDVTEGGKSMAGQKVRFALSDSLDIRSGGDVIAKTAAEVVLDSSGNGSIRLPIYSDSVQTWCGKDWAILVTSTWGSRKAIRVPAGTGDIALSSLPNIRPLSAREQLWAVTGVSLNVTTGSTAGQASGTASLNGGVLSLNPALPPAGPHTHGQIENSAGRWSVTSEGGAQLVVGSTERFVIGPDGVITKGSVASLTGVGTPQGVVHAGEGAIYTETSAPTAEYHKRLQWVKKTGAFTNNGWDVISGYTERDIRPLASNVNADATVRLMVKDGFNGIRFSNVKPQSSGAVVELFASSGPLAGYAPTWTFQDVVSNGLAGATRTVQVNSAGRIAILQGSPADALNGTIWWPRQRDLPVSWVGDAA